MKEKPKLFRYRSDGQYSVDAALQSKMYFVCPLELNDPFEFYIKYDIDKVYDLIKNEPSAKEIVSKMLYEFSFNFADIGGYRAKPKPLKKCVELFDNPMEIARTKQRLKKEIERRIIRFKESFGIVSLTENPREPVMWSHYSNDSKGFLEVYDAELVCFNFRSYLNCITKDYSKEQAKAIGIFRIKYVDTFPERNEFVKKLLCSKSKLDSNIGLELIDDEDTANEVLDIATSKLSPWKYEKEVRLILPCDIYNLNRKKTESGSIVHDHFFENAIAEPIKIVLGYKGNTQLEYALSYYCLKHKIEFEKSNEFFEFTID